MGWLDTLVAQPLPLRADQDGVVRIGGTRVTLATLVDAYESGATAEEIVQAYDSLELADVHAVISYYLRHRLEISRYLAEQRARAAMVRDENEKRFPPHGIRERLLARKRERPG